MSCRGIARLGDMCSGHGCWPPRANIEASEDVICNNKGVHCEGHAWEIHCCPADDDDEDDDCHDGVLAGGSEIVIVNNRRVGRCEDEVSCGSTVETCSEDTFA